MKSKPGCGVPLAVAAAALIFSLIPAPSGLAADVSASSRTLLEAKSELPPLVGRVVRLRTGSGGEFQGRLLAVLEDRVELVNGEGEVVQVYREEIIQILEIDPDARRSTFFQDAAANQLIVMPTGFGLDPGEIHISVHEFVIVTGSYGVTEHFSLWGGISIPGALLNARWSFPVGDRAGVSVGTFAGLSWIELGGILMPYSLLSIGEPNRNFTAGVAVPGLVGMGNSPRIGAVLVALAGKVVLSQTAAVITENWFILSGDENRWDGTPFFIVPSVVFRIAGSRFSWDIGAALPMVIDESYSASGIELRGFPLDNFIPLPILAFSYRIQ